MSLWFEVVTRFHEGDFRSMSRAATEYRYEKLTWPEINDAVDLGKVCIVPCGAVEQHGPHLPFKWTSSAPAGPPRSPPPPAPRRGPRLPGRRRHRGRQVDPGQDAGPAGRRLRVHRAR